jgi:putative DNA-invertase from lambdoid prophage Rac
MIDLGGDTTGNGVSKLVFTILPAVAEAERERITEVKADQRRLSRYLGGTAPFGWKLGDDGDLVPVPEQQRAIETMRRLRAKGLPLRAIADKLKASGTPISHQGVKKVLLAVERSAA